MKIIIVKLSKVMQGNPKICIRPLRALNQCFKCKFSENCKSKRRNFEKDRLLRSLKSKKENALKELFKVNNEIEELING